MYILLNNFLNKWKHELEVAYPYCYWIFSVTNYLWQNIMIDDNPSIFQKSAEAIKQWIEKMKLFLFNIRNNQLEESKYVD